MDPKKLDEIDARRFVRYLQRPLPVPEDRQVAELLWNVFHEGRGGDWSSSGLPRGTRDVLNTFAERMASLAVRDQDPDDLRVGLLALVLGGLDEGDRGSLPVAALLYDAATRLGMDPASLFGTTGLQIGEPGLTALRAFAARKEEDRTIEAMGYRNRDRPDGLLYQRTW